MEKCKWDGQKSSLFTWKTYYQNTGLYLYGQTANNQPGATAFMLGGSFKTCPQLWPRLNCEKMVIVKYSFSIHWIEKIWKYFLGWKGLINLMVEAGVDFSVLTSHPAIFFQNLFLGICLIWFISAELQVSYDSFSE